jgi:hypothetical protein
MIEPEHEISPEPISTSLETETLHDFPLNSSIIPRIRKKPYKFSGKTQKNRFTFLTKML